MPMRYYGRMKLYIGLEENGATNHIYRIPTKTVVGSTPYEVTTLCNRTLSVHEHGKWNDGDLDACMACLAAARALVT